MSTPEAPRKSHKLRNAVIVAGLVIAAGVGINSLHDPLSDPPNGKTAAESAAQVAEAIGTTQAVADPVAASTDSFPDGTYLIGSQIPQGNYQCANAGQFATWLISDKSGNLVKGSASAVAFVIGGYSVQLGGCDTTWTLVP